MIREEVARVLRGAWTRTISNRGGEYHCAFHAFPLPRQHEGVVKISGGTAACLINKIDAILSNS